MHSSALILYIHAIEWAGSSTNYFYILPISSHTAKAVRGLFFGFFGAKLVSGGSLSLLPVYLHLMDLFIGDLFSRTFFNVSPFCLNLSFETLPPSSAGISFRIKKSHFQNRAELDMNAIISSPTNIMHKQMRWEVTEPVGRLGYRTRFGCVTKFF